MLDQEQQHLNRFCFLLLSTSYFGTAILRSEFTDGNMWFPAFVTTKRHDKKQVFLALGNRGMQTFKLLNFAQYQFLQSTWCWSKFSSLHGLDLSLPSQSSCVRVSNFHPRMDWVVNSYENSRTFALGSEDFIHKILLVTASTFMVPKKKWTRFMLWEKEKYLVYKCK
jgi:hypothetical protein